MPAEPSKDATEVLVRASRGDLGASSNLVSMVYQELRERAASYLRRESPHGCLHPTELVHEAYIRRVERSKVGQRRQAFLRPFSGRSGQIR
jgi:hypothetical protein